MIPLLGICVREMKNHLCNNVCVSRSLIAPHRTSQNLNHLVKGKQTVTLTHSSAPPAMKRQQRAAPCQHGFLSKAGGVKEAMHERAQAHSNKSLPWQVSNGITQKRVLLGRVEQDWLRKFWSQEKAMEHNLKYATKVIRVNALHKWILCAKDTSAAPRGLVCSLFFKRRMKSCKSPSPHLLKTTQEFFPCTWSKSRDRRCSTESTVPLGVPSPSS